MKRILAAGTAMLLAMGTAGAASAEPIDILIDDFQTESLVRDNTVGNGAETGSSSYNIDGNFFGRVLSVNQTDNPNNDGQYSSGNISGGRFFVNNDSQANSIVTLVYNIDSLIDDIEGGSTLKLVIDAFDHAFAQAMTISAALNGEQRGSYTITSPVSNPDQTLTFDLQALAASGNELRLTFSGGTSFDATFLPISIRIGDGGQIPVPEPGALGLLGLGLASVAFARRRKVAA